MLGVERADGGAVLALLPDRVEIGDVEAAERVQP